MGIGKYSEATDIQVAVDTVGDEAFGICIDEGSNMVKAFEDFGGSCVDHRLSNGLKDALKPPVVADIVKGISAHFNRSSKGWRKLEEVASQQRVKVTKPPRCSECRWGGIIPLLQWGITYGPVAQMLTMMEATSVPTFSCVLPMFGSLHAAMDEDATAVALIDGETTDIEMEVWESRNTFKDSIQRRILSNNPSYTEDALTATALDPRWKTFDFPGAGRLMRADAYNYLRGAYKDDWAPPAPCITPAPVAPATKRTAFNAAPVKKAKLSGVERLFSAAGRMHHDFKKSTSETTLEHALIVYKNLD
eukprot:jgi/Tetstr1/461765/TSEL_006854.t1